MKAVKGGRVVKKALAWLAVFAAFFSVCPAYGAQNWVFVVFEGEKMVFDQPPAMIDGTVFVPIRDIALKTGAVVLWRDGTVTLQKGDTTVRLIPGEDTMDKDGEQLPLPAPPVIAESRMLAPVRVLTEALGCTVFWNGENRGVYISLPEDAHRNYQKEREAFALVNGIRKACGLPVFIWDDGLAGVARTHSRDMAENSFFAHASSAGASPFDRMNAAGILYRFAAENIASNYTDPARVVDGWMNSEEHRANILNGNLSRMGIGFYDNYWTQDFIN